MISAAQTASQLVRLSCSDTGGSTIIERAKAEAHIADHSSPEIWSIEEFKACQCCGQPAYIWWGKECQIARCRKHHDSNPCAIEGCERSTKAHENRLANNQWLCAWHWRALVPPRSLARRTYHAFFRRAKRHGWDDRSTAQFYKFWNLLVIRCRRRSSGHLDIREIERMFGLDAPNPLKEKNGADD